MDSSGEAAAPEAPARARAKDFVAEERAHRLAKEERLIARTGAAYRFDRDHTLAQVRDDFGGLEAGGETDTRVRVAGRVMLIRRHGGLVFADLRDQTATVQLVFARDTLDAAAFGDLADLDRGDWIGVEGTPMRTRTGELSIRVREWRLLKKCLRALPDKHRGLADVDTRLRQRYLDLIANPPTRRVFDVRSAVIAAVRAVLTERGFTEVETPVLDASAGGAAARPFITHHNALDIDMYMRIALELPLKRLVVGGFERVFEIGRVFRNEGLDTRHNPEFTLLEAYQALADYHDMMDLVESICSQAASTAAGSTRVTVEGREVELKPPWRRVRMADLIEEVHGVRMHPRMPLEDARAICDRFGVPYESEWGAGRLMAEVYDETCEQTLTDPTFVYDYPREVSPLARTHREDPELVERFEAVVAGRELANAYTELNDPIDQRARFEAEAAAKAAGDEEAEDVDDDYIRALEYGLPPTGGLGIGLDRLVMLISGAETIREVILFPTMRPEAGTAPRAGRRGLASGLVPTAAALASPAAADGSDGGLAGAAQPVQQESQTSVDQLQEPPAPGARTHPLAAPSRAAPAAGPPRPRAARILAWLTALGGLLNLLALLPAAHDRHGIADHLLDLPGRVVGHVASVVIGLALLLVARQLARGKRRAWEVALVLFAAGAVVSVLKGPHPVLALYTVAMVVALVWHRDAFPARPDPGSLFQVAGFAAGYLVLVFTFGTVTLLLEQEHVEQELTVWGVVKAIVAGLIGLDGPYTYTGRFFKDFFPAALLALGIAGVLILSALVFRALARRERPSDADRARARELVRAYGSDTLDFFALRPDKSYFFSAADDAMIAYTYASGYALVAADPIGAPGSSARVVDEFLAFCRERAWRVAFLAAREADMPMYRARGFREVYLGDEAVIPCDTFSLSGSAMKSVRSAVARVGKNHSFRLMREVDAAPQLCEELNAIRERWRGKAPERGFTMELGGGVRGDDPDLLLAVAYDASERPVGFLRLVPCFGDDPGWSLDLMQRDPDAPNGITEFLIANAALALGERGFRRLSMNFAAWGRLFDSSEHLTLPQRGLRKLAELLNPYFQIKSLRDFNAKFDPRWVPRSIVVDDPAAMPKVGLLYATVEGFLNLPVIGRYLAPR
ncbi:MAG: lysine--tRNA ligase [Thermoleophilaceae bacterium]|nr:lysine--tRNA ligase [Thermoleophilaceae bacterium]